MNAKQKYQRVMIIGSGGAGKSTLSNHLSDLLSLPLHHIDRIYWQENWVRTSEKEYINAIKDIVDQDKWIIDGNNKSTFYLRVPRADLIIYLDFPPLVCFYRAFLRAARKKHRPDMADGCVERFDLDFYKWILLFRRQSRPIILDLIQQYNKGADFVQIQNKQQLSEFMTSVQFRR